MPIASELAAIATQLIDADRRLDAIWDRADWKLRYRLDLIRSYVFSSAWGLTQDTFTLQPDCPRGGCPLSFNSGFYPGSYQEPLHPAGLTVCPRTSGLSPVSPLLGVPDTTADASCITAIPSLTKRRSSGGIYDY